MTELTAVQVCTDCYFAHHYGWREPYPGQFTTGPDFGLESAVDRQPLGLLPEIGHVSGGEVVTFISDWTCSDHDANDRGPCTHCGSDGFDDGITTFSMSSCDGCGSRLGGSRYRLAIHWEEIPEHAH